MSLDAIQRGGIIGGRDEENSGIELQYCYNKGNVNGRDLTGGIARRCRTSYIFRQ